MLTIKLKPLVISILIPLAVGGLSAWLSMDGMREYSQTAVQPPLSPPMWLFPVVWSILYILMGISSYIIYMKNPQNGSNALPIYAAQLIVNFFWSIIFFRFKLYFLAFLWLLLLIGLVIAMIVSFSRISKLAGYLQIPYLVWLVFAGYLNYMVFMLN